MIRYLDEHHSDLIDREKQLLVMFADGSTKNEILRFFSNTKYENAVKSIRKKKELSVSVKEYALILNIEYLKSKVSDLQKVIHKQDDKIASLADKINSKALYK